MGKQIGKTTPSILFFTVLIETDWLIVALPVEENLLFFSVFFPSFPGRKSRVQSFKSGIELQRLRHLWKSVIYLISQVFFTASDAPCLQQKQRKLNFFFFLYSKMNEFLSLTVLCCSTLTVFFCLFYEATWSREKRAWNTRCI